jgi:hypothetical protein
MTAYSLDVLGAMGTVTKENITLSANLFFTAMPGSVAQDAIILDLFGATGDITISGVYTSSDGTISTFIDALEACVDGKQTVAQYVSGKSGNTYYVYIDSITWDAEEGAVNKVNYTITMKMGG